MTCSLHKAPVRAYEELHRLVQEVPDSVIIAYIGRSNGAGPTLSAQVSVPVITVPATWKECYEDVWSSLRTPSETPAMTILEPKNAVLAALQILAMRNPRLYAELRFRQEERLYNFVQI
jgi:phosphoribosylaminoimidazole carboxylase/phosphoribosylaminoimidazole-succinocarboxamide synthase